MTRSRHPHHEVQPAAGGAAHCGPETEIVAIQFGDGRGGGPTGTDRLSPPQLCLLAALTRLHDSLRGPQTQLEAADHFSRPQFPAQPQRDDSIETSGARS
jgi:hypothetical protein